MKAILTRGDKAVTYVAAPSVTHSLSRMTVSKTIYAKSLVRRTPSSHTLFLPPPLQGCAADCAGEQPHGQRQRDRGGRAARQLQSCTCGLEHIRQGADPGAPNSGDGPGHRRRACAVPVPPRACAISWDCGLVSCMVSDDGGGSLACTQSVYELSDGSGMVLTVGRYLTPSRIDIDRQGLTPDFNTLPSFEAAQERVKCVPPHSPRPQPYLHACAPSPALASPCIRLVADNEGDGLLRVVRKVCVRPAPAGQAGLQGRM